LANEFRTVLTSIGDAIIVVNRDAKVVLFNPAAEELTGLVYGDVRGKPLHDVLRVQTELKQATHIDIAEVLHTRKRKSICQHMFVLRANGDIVPITYCASPITTHGGDVRGVVLTVRDVSREYEIGKMKSEFVSIVSHQLRTPLTSVKWFLETVLDAKETLTENQYANVEQAFQSNERMIYLVNDLLNVSRLEKGNVKNVPEAVDASALFSTIVSEMCTFAHANNVTVDSSACGPETPSVWVDPTTVRQVIQNVLSNAIKYTHGRQTVIITADVQPAEVIFSIRDHGIGIPANDQRRLFEPFFRAENALAMQAEGSGLGLYICRLLLQFNDGRIWVDSALGKGATFSFSLPRADARPRA
jgi:PAS domain S-box-containing protein